MGALKAMKGAQRPCGSVGRKPSADGLPNMRPAGGEPMSGAQRPRGSAGRKPFANGLPNVLAGGRRGCI